MLIIKKNHTHTKTSGMRCGYLGGLIMGHSLLTNLSENDPFE
jgi:hypothetical protein